MGQRDPLDDPGALAVRELKIESSAEAGAPLRADMQGAAVLGPFDPGEPDQPIEPPASDAAGEMMALFAPVDAVPNGLASWRQEDAKVVEERSSRRCQLVGEIESEASVRVAACVCRLEAAVSAAQITPIQHRAHDADAELAGDVVIAGARLSKRLSVSTLSQGADGPRRCESLQRLDHVCDRWAREPGVAVPAVRLDGDEPRVGQLAEVAAGGRGTDACLCGQTTCRERAPVIEGEQEAGTARVPGEGGDHGDVGLAPLGLPPVSVAVERHISTITRRRFDDSQSFACVDSQWICANSEGRIQLTEQNPTPQLVREHPEQIPGYDYGTDRAPSSPLTLEDLERLKEAVWLTDEDETALRQAALILAPKADDMVSFYRARLGEQPWLAPYSPHPHGTPNPQLWGGA